MTLATQGNFFNKVWHPWQSVTLWQSMKSMTKWDMCDKVWHPWQCMRSLTVWLFITMCDICDYVWHPWQRMTSVTKYYIHDKVWHPWHSVTNMTQCDQGDNMQTKKQTNLVLTSLLIRQNFIFLQLIWYNVQCNVCAF